MWHGHLARVFTTFSNCTSADSVVIVCCWFARILHGSNYRNRSGLRSIFIANYGGTNGRGTEDAESGAGNLNFR